MTEPGGRRRGRERDCEIKEKMKREQSKSTILVNKISQALKATI